MTNGYSRSSGRGVTRVGGNRALSRLVRAPTLGHWLCPAFRDEQAGVVGSQLQRFADAVLTEIHVVDDLGVLVRQPHHCTVVHSPVAESGCHVDRQISPLCDRSNRSTDLLSGFGLTPREISAVTSFLAQSEARSPKLLVCRIVSGLSRNGNRTMSQRMRAMRDGAEKCAAPARMFRADQNSVGVAARQCHCTCCRMRRRVVAIRLCATCGGELRPALRSAAKGLVTDADSNGRHDAARPVAMAHYTCIVCGRAQTLPVRRATDRRSLSE